ncbi:CD177 antigen-like isoform X2 [Mus caroli]|nr:CD177 antigen-like isoform X2 [Mus caroli]
MKFGQNFSKTSIEWIVDRTIALESNKGKMCQETFLLIDVGEKSLILGTKGITTVPGKIKKTDVFSPGPGIVSASYVHFCDTELCNNARSTSVLLNNMKLSEYNEPGTTKCPVCLDFKGSCGRKSNHTLCPKDTKCYATSLGVNGGGLSVSFGIFGCLNSSYTYLLNNRNTIGAIRIKETLESHVTLSSHVLVPSILLTWMFGLLALCLQRSVLC